MSALDFLAWGILIGFGLGFILGLIVGILILKHYLFDYIPSPEAQRVLGCTGRCLQKGLMLGTTEFHECVQECMRGKAEAGR